MWKQVRSPKDIFPPPAMGRFLMLVKLAGEAYPLNETGMDDSDPWRFCRMPVDEYNDHMDEVFSAGWNIGPDESMSAYVGETAPPAPTPIKPHQLPHAMFVPPTQARAAWLRAGRRRGRAVGRHLQARD